MTTVETYESPMNKNRDSPHRHLNSLVSETDITEQLKLATYQILGTQREYICEICGEVTIVRIIFEKPIICTKW